MRKTKFLFFFLALYSCNQYVGTIDPDYEPLNEVTEIFPNVQMDIENDDVILGNTIYPKVINPDLLINNIDLIKLINTDNKSVVSFINNKIFLSKDKNIYKIDNNNKHVYKLSLNKDEEVHQFFEYKDDIYILTNSSRLFVLDEQNASLVTDYGVYINNNPILLNEFIIILSVFGDIYQINMNDKSILKIGNFNPKPGSNIKSNIFQDKTNLYYLFNTGTLLVFEKDNYKFHKNYIIEDINILSSFGSFNELVDTPFSYKGNLYFLERSGEIVIYNPLTSNILWEFDINNTLLNYLFTNDGYLILLTPDKILVLSDKGTLINSFSHNKDLPITIFNLKENIYLISEEGISILNLNDKKEVSFYKNNFTSNLDVYYQDQNIYLKDDKSLYILSE